MCSFEQSLSTWSSTSGQRRLELEISMTGPGSGSKRRRQILDVLEPFELYLCALSTESESCLLACDGNVTKYVRRLRSVTSTLR